MAFSFQRGAVSHGIDTSDTVALAAWYRLMQLWSPGLTAGPYASALRVVGPFFDVVGYRLVLVSVFQRTATLLLMVLIDAALTPSAIALNPASFAGAPGLPVLTFDLVRAVAAWAMVTAVGVVNGGQLTRHHSRRRRREWARV